MLCFAYISVSLGGGKVYTEDLKSSGGNSLLVRVQSQGLVFPFILAAIGACKRVAVWTQKTKVFNSIIRVISIDMIEMKAQFLPTPLGDATL